MGSDSAHSHLLAKLTEGSLRKEEEENVGKEDETKTSVWYRELQEDPESRYCQSYYIQQLDSDASGAEDLDDFSDGESPKSSPFTS
jgi:hypothetical protein